MRRTVACAGAGATTCGGEYVGCGDGCGLVEGRVTGRLGAAGGVGLGFGRGWAFTGGAGAGAGAGSGAGGGGEGTVTTGSVGGGSWASATAGAARAAAATEIASSSHRRTLGLRGLVVLASPSRVTPLDGVTHLRTPGTPLDPRD